MAKKNRKKQNRQKKLASQLAVVQSEEASKVQKRRAKKYINMKTNKGQRVEILPKEFETSRLAEFKERLQPMVHEANMRIEMIKSANYTSYALDRVIQEGGKDYFDLEDINTREDLITEMTRMRVFINDKGSTIEGARMQTAQIYSEQYRGKFGAEYKSEENGNRSFDTNIIDEEVAKRAFRAYRMIEEDKAALIGRQGMPGVYGSENLIIAIYDAEVRGKDSFMYGIELLEAYEKEANRVVDSQQQRANEVNAISGIIEEQMKGGRLW